MAEGGEMEMLIQDERETLMHQHVGESHCIDRHIVCQRLQQADRYG